MLNKSTESNILKTKLKSLNQYLSEDLEQLNPTPGENTKKSELVEFTHQLFKKASEDFLTRSTTEDLAEIAAKSYRLYQNFLSSKDDYQVEFFSTESNEDRPGYTSVFCCLSDRAFVIDSLLEFWRKEDIDHYVSLYPVLKTDDGTRVAVVYMQIEQIAEKSRFAKVEESINSIISDVILATDDFPQMLAQAETAAKLLELGVGFFDEKSHDERNEIAELLRWLAQDGYIFLGYREWIVKEQGAKQNLSHILSLNENMDLGIFKSTNLVLQDYLIEIQKDIEHLINSNDLLFVSSTHVNSTVHRNVPLSLINVKVPQKEGRTTKIFCFLGFYSTIFKTRDAKSIPLIRKKVERILETEEVLPNSHDYKEIVSILECIPKAQLLKQPTDSIYETVKMVLGMQRRKEVKVAFYEEPNKRHFSALVVMPKAKFSRGVRSKILWFLAEAFTVSHEKIDQQTFTAAAPLVILHYDIPNSESLINPSFLEDLEKEIISITNTWDDRLAEALIERYGKTTGKFLAQFYQEIFPENYKADIAPLAALRDIEYIEQLRKENPLNILIQKLDNAKNENSYFIKLYNLGAKFTLSNILPYLEFVGFHVHSETETELTKDGESWVNIYNLRVSTTNNDSLNVKQIQEILIPGIKEILSKEAESGPLSRLLINPGLNIRQIAVLRALVKYLWQIKVFASEKIIQSALIQNPEMAQILYQYFDTKFNPELFANNPELRAKELGKVKNLFLQQLKTVQKLISDRALRALLNIIDATVRTNAYQSLRSNTIAIKIDCKLIEKMPIPRPMYEIFVNGPDVSGVHQRGGKVARGGIRWSDRAEDFRTEVLSLSKTQIVKNSIIIPTGAKGGFVVNRESRDNLELRENVEICYKTFIRSLLQITDNRKGSEVIRPKNTICYDGEDPYLVVAADKGTATFSDIANKIATDEFDFWLGDAFASGGSNGYDHKKLAITARGAWVAACRHFRELGHDVNKQEFTLVGIGDMSGDVFGNGLLQNDNAKLIAAFNHKHIFIDPTPDSKISFAERKRLFELPHSNWTDYDTKLISKGGSIFDRSQKEIQLSPEAQSALGTNLSKLSANELIKVILKAPVDLIWNGGIGTYVKGSNERDLDVGDPSNDEVRVDARELRSRIIAEGGNLGLTQRARIEFTKIGGRINTDAVDNSGGVDLSDLEVNLKILFKGPVDRGELTLDERNKILEQNAPLACEKVVRRNNSQSKAISLGITRSQQHVDYYAGLLSKLEDIGLLNREAEFLPSNKELEERSELKTGLTRPELAVIIGYVKMWLTNIIVDSTLPEDTSLDVFLMGYFPKELHKRFGRDIAAHPLRREIIATQLANKLVERMGASYVYRIASETGKSEIEIIRAFLISVELIKAASVTEELIKYDTSEISREFYYALQNISDATDSISKWILSLSSAPLRTADIIKSYTKPIQSALENVSSILPTLEEQEYRSDVAKLMKKGFENDLACKISALPYLTSFLGAIKIAVEFKKEVAEVGKLYASLSMTLHISQLMLHAEDMLFADKWEFLLIGNSIASFNDSLTQITQKIIEETGSADLASMDKFLSSRSDAVAQLSKHMKEFSHRAMTPAALSIMASQLRGLANK